MIGVSFKIVRIKEVYPDPILPTTAMKEDLFASIFIFLRQASLLSNCYLPQNEVRLFI